MKYLLTAACLTLGTVASAQDITGIWQTEANDEGSFLHVSFAPCGDKVCGTIGRAFNKDLEAAPNYEHSGKNMVWDMAPSGEGSWKGGKIWDPSKDKTYSSKMEMTGDNLKVSGCVASVFCQSQVWRKVQ